MLKKMRWHFILAAMAAVFIMLVAVLAGINVWNYHNTASRADQRIQEIYTFEASNGTDAAGEMGPATDASQNSEIPPVNAENTSNPLTGQKLAETKQSENKPTRTESAETEQSEDEPAQSEQTETLPPVPGPGQERDPEAPYTTRFFLVKLDENEEITKVSTDFIASVTQEEAEEYARNVLNGKRKKGYYKNYRFQIISDNNGKIVIFLNCSMELHSAWNVLLISCLMGIVCFFIVFLLVLLLSRRAMEPYIRNMERQKRFITDASHEIKTPLTSIATSVDVIEMEHGTDEWTDNIHKQTAKMSRMVAEPFASLAKAQGKAYTQRIEENLTLCGNPDSIRQMISILLDNALKYSDEHGSIRLDVYKVHGKTKIEVFNTCILEDTRNLSRLFDRFYHPDDSRSKKTGGTGIGLSIAQAVAEAYGGKIKVHSKDGKSILFQVSI